ncbi:hypothetical protein PFISCL1PPCAC_26001, partial [Pristionchus fissidentatus]
ALNFSSTDRLGNTITRAFQLMQAVAKNDSDHENMENLANVLMKMERELSLEQDESCSPLRDLVRSFSAGLKISIQSIIKY